MRIAIFVYSSSKRSRNLSEMSIIPSLFGTQGLLDPFSGFIWGQPLSGEGSEVANVRVDWKETPETHVIKADLPGLKKEEVKVEVEEGRVLRISGERKREHEEKVDTWHRVERNYGQFVRRFRLPDNAKVEEVKASMENGVLTILLPKEAKKEEKKTIEISG